MYNRYIPGTNGIYERRTVREPDRISETKTELQPPEVCVDAVDEIKPGNCRARRLIPQGIDIGDLLLLCIVLLLLIDADEDDLIPLLITAAVFLFT